jgi:hypothetical protein
VTRRYEKNIELLPLLGQPKGLIKPSTDKPQSHGSASDSKNSMMGLNLKGI